MSTETTLISSRGWRLTRHQTATGIILEWRCPSCWAQYKAGRSPASGGGAVSRRDDE